MPPALGKPLPAVIVKAVQAHVVAQDSMNTTSAAKIEVVTRARLVIHGSVVLKKRN